MNQSKDFIDGVAHALQQLYDFELKHGHLHLDSLAANSLSVEFRDYAIVFIRGKFEVVTRATPYGEIFIAALL